MSDLGRPPRTYLHIGAPKTGSTYVQAMLWANRDALLERGVEMLGVDQGQHYRAGHDLRGLRFNPADPGIDWTGAWDRMAQRAQASCAHAVIISDEHLAALSPDQVARAVEALAPREVHVVYVTRDLVGLLPSEYQEFVKHGATASYGDWAADVLLSPGHGPGAWFWRVHDAQGVVSRWATSVPRERIHLVTMPPSDAPRNEIWRRFASVLTVDPAAGTTDPGTSNTSLSPAAVEVLRRVNADLPKDLPRWHRTGLVRDVLANRVLHPLGNGQRLELPENLRADVLSRAERAHAALPTLGCDIVGDVADLVIDPAKLSGSPPPGSDVLVDITVGALAGLTEYAGEVTDLLSAERSERARAEAATREEHHLAMQAALAAQDAAFWAEHPMARRIQAGKERIVAAEQSNSVVRAAMSGYRRARSRQHP